MDIKPDCIRLGFTFLRCHFVSHPLDRLFDSHFFCLNIFSNNHFFSKQKNRPDSANMGALIICINIFYNVRRVIFLRDFVLMSRP